METTHAWFSASAALVHGSCVYRKPDDSTVNVTRMNPEKEAKGRRRVDEKYVGEVIRLEAGGCVRGNARVKGI